MWRGLQVVTIGHIVNADDIHLIAAESHHDEVGGRADNRRRRGQQGNVPRFHFKLFDEETPDEDAEEGGKHTRYACKPELW